MRGTFASGVADESEKWQSPRGKTAGKWRWLIRLFRRFLATEVKEQHDLYTYRCKRSRKRLNSNEFSRMASGAIRTPPPRRVMLIIFSCSYAPTGFCPKCWRAIVCQLLDLRISRGRSRTGWSCGGLRPPMRNGQTIFTGWSPRNEWLPQAAFLYSISIAHPIVFRGFFRIWSRFTRVSETNHGLRETHSACDKARSRRPRSGSPHVRQAGIFLYRQGFVPPRQRAERSPNKITLFAPKMNALHSDILSDRSLNVKTLNFPAENRPFRSHYFLMFII